MNASNDRYIMKLSKEQALAIAGETSRGLLIINLVAGQIEIAAVEIGPIHHATLKELADAAARAITARLKELGGCQCPMCMAERALSHNAPKAQA
jgi:hypothetical protein